MKLKKPHPSRLVGGAERQNGLFPHPYVVSKNSTESPGWCGSVDCGRKFWGPKQFFLKNSHMDLFRVTPSELQHQVAA